MTGDDLRLSVENLRIELANGDPIVESFELRLEPGKILGLVGESASGKTTSALALLGYHDPGLVIASGDIMVGDIRVKHDESARGVRGRLISYVPQDPGRALNPSLRIGDAIKDVVRAHRPDRLSATTARDMQALVGLPSTPEFSRRFPHQLSGGQQQRVCIALALACEPSVVVLDEPTTGLDVVTQARILDELARLRADQGVSMLYVTHNLAVVAKIADGIAVMYGGRIVEQGPARAVLRDPRHPYTRGLLASIPDHLHPRVLRAMPGVAAGVGERPEGCAFAPRCPQRVTQCTETMPPVERIVDDRYVRCFRWSDTPSLRGIPPREPAQRETGQAVPVLDVIQLRAEYSSRKETVVAADDVSFELHQRSCVALVGESGSGKTTIARVIAGLHPAAAGEIRLFGEALPMGKAALTRDRFRRVQLVFQNPADALNPRHSVHASIARPARILRGLDKEECNREVARLLDLVRLPARLGERFPGELSGGERQRVAMARALVAQPDLIVCDEITSALDVSVQAAILDLLQELRRELGLSLLFITHDLGVVAAIADHVVVLKDGVVCEQAPTMDILRAPQHPYTQRLLEAAPSIAGVAA